jgi:hypothetical protein
MLPLQKARDEGLAVLVVRHERKGSGPVGESGRGSNALSGAVDIILQLKRPEGSHSDTHRSIESRSRFEDTPVELTIALIDGEYQVLGESDAVAVPQAIKRVLKELDCEEADSPTVKQLEAATGIPRTTLQTALERLASEGRIGKKGSGKKNDPVRYHKIAAQTPSHKSNAPAESDAATI